MDKNLKTWYNLIVHNLVSYLQCLHWFYYLIWMFFLYPPPLIWCILISIEVVVIWQTAITPCYNTVSFMVYNNGVMLFIHYTAANKLPILSMMIIWRHYIVHCTLLTTRGAKRLFLSECWVSIKPMKHVPT